MCTFHTYLFYTCWWALYEKKATCLPTPYLHGTFFFYDNRAAYLPKMIALDMRSRKLLVSMVCTKQKDNLFCVGKVPEIAKSPLRN